MVRMVRMVRSLADRTFQLCAEPVGLDALVRDLRDQPVAMELREPRLVDPDAPRERDELRVAAVRQRFRRVPENHTSDRFVDLGQSRPVVERAERGHPGHVVLVEPQRRPQLREVVVRQVKPALDLQ